jgi:hypothetical protein
MLRLHIHWVPRAHYPVSEWGSSLTFTYREDWEWLRVNAFVACLAKTFPSLPQVFCYWDKTILFGNITHYFYFYFCTVHFVLCLWITNWFLSVYYFILPLLHFSTCVSSSGSSSVPTDLHANRMQWLKRLCVIRGYVSVLWRPCVHRCVWLRYQVRYRPPHNRHTTTYNAEFYQPLHSIRM